MPLFPIETERLVLRALEPMDAGRVEKYASDPEIARYTANIPEPYSSGLAVSWIKEVNKDMLTRKDYAAAIAEKESGDLVGAVSLAFPDYGKGGELGYWIGRPYWGRGYASEAVKKMVVVAFNRLGLHRVWAGVLPENEASIRVMEKSGLVFEGETEYDFPARGGIKQVWIYGLNRMDAVAKRDILGAAIMSS